MSNSARLLGFAFATGMVFLGACGGGEEDASNTDIGNVAGGSSSCTLSYRALYDYSATRSKNTGDTQCLTQLQAAEAHYQAAIASCKAGSMTAASQYYSYYQQSQSLVKFSCKL